MEFIPRDDTRPRRQARHLMTELAAHGIRRDLPACLDGIAHAYGHASWAALRRRIGRDPACALDDEADADTVAARRSVYEAAFAALGLSGADAADVAEAVRPTARRHGRTALSAARVTFLDLPWTEMAQLTRFQTELMADVLERERVMNVHRKPAGLASTDLERFLRTVPENVRAVASRFVDAPYAVTFGLLTFLGMLSRSHEEASIWVATLQELCRRLEGRTVGMGHFAEAFSPGVPTEEAVATTLALRAAGRRTTGMPRFEETLAPGAIGLMVNGLKRKPYVVFVPEGGFDAFMARHEQMFEGSPADPSEDVDALLGLQVELLKANAMMSDDDPELARSAGILLWLALVHPTRGQAIRDAVDAALEGGAAYVTLTVSDTLSVRTSVAGAFEDRARIQW